MFCSEPTQSDQMVNVTMSFTVTTPPSGCSGRALMKKEHLSKLGHISVSSVMCTEFITVFLKLHNIADKYSPGVHSGPPFKL